MYVNPIKAICSDVQRGFEELFVLLATRAAVWRNACYLQQRFSFVQNVDLQIDPSQ